MNAQDTIVAVSSPPGRSSRGLIRLSGPDLAPLLQQLLNTTAPPPFHATPCRIERLPVLLTRMAAPRSYTGQDMAEVQLPGNPALLERLLRRLLMLGARLAEPGEFTLRAFLAGKLDLTQAEGVAATIAAASEGQLQAASLLRAGELGRFAARLVDEVARQLALVEAGIDFTDQDDVVPIAPAALAANLAGIATQLAALLGNSRRWTALEALPRVVIAGAPSTGKSTLFNALLGRHRAVMSPMPGTTRDVLTEPLTLTTAAGQRVEVMLVDIAGLDTPQSLLDRQAQDAARRAIHAADVILHLSDRGHFVTSNEWPRVPVLRLRTKSDARGPDTDDPHLAICAPTGAGLSELRHRLADLLADRAVSLTADTLALQPRHASALGNAADHLRQAGDLLAAQHQSRSIEQSELIANALRAALNELACLGGHLTPDDIIGRIFATFCIGK